MEVCASSRLFVEILLHVCVSGASFVGMHVSYVKQMRLYHREGHSWVLNTATARVCLMSQRADGSCTQLRLTQLAIFTFRRAILGIIQSQVAFAHTFVSGSL